LLDEQETKYLFFVKIVAILNKYKNLKALITIILNSYHNDDDDYLNQRGEITSSSKRKAFEFLK
jgi:hypothetical protein